MMERDELKHGLVSTDKSMLLQRNKEKMLMSRIVKLENKIEELSEIVSKLLANIDPK